MPRVPYRVLLLASVLAPGLWGVSLVYASAIGLPDLVAGGAFMVAFILIGTLIEGRRPGNLIGRICLGSGVVLVVSQTLQLVAVELDRQPGSLGPGGALVALLAGTGGSVGLIQGTLLLISRFPDGRMAGWLGRTVDAAIGVSMAGLLLGALKPGRLDTTWLAPVANPIGIDFLGSGVGEVLTNLTFGGYGVGLAGGLVSLGIRYRRSQAVARAQIRWFIAAICVSIVLFLLMLVAGETMSEYLWPAWILSFLLTPIAVGIAILRYRLYEIDRIISRTIGWALVTALLVAVFAGVVVALQTVLAGITQGQTLAVAASTLVAFAIFQPVRRRVQSAVDRRFDRARYDGERTAEAFAEQLRNEVDLARLGTALVATADDAVRPVNATVWLRAGADRAP